ncbi:MAG: CDP-glycerol glycerophosphotransferase family protein, partial [Candidatus Cloacimonetes bacterium]|nr:CDP-glycerol glycerophosphotransferase family protein [Candidatus Cloacimonadota bacterium]
LMISDLCIGDTSSLLAECVALDKPVITFRTPRAKRSLDEIDELLDLFSTRITNFDELLATIPELLANPAKNQSGRAQARALMFDSLDGKAGWRAAQHIQALLNPKS